MRILSLLKNPNTLTVSSMILLVLIILQTIRCLTSVKIPIEMTPLNIEKHTTPHVAQWHLFGKFDQRNMRLPQTHLPIVLEGTIINKKNAALSYALINNGEKTQIYHVGQTIAGATIQKIQHKNIILKNQGVLESLSLPIKTLNLE